MFLETIGNPKFYPVPVVDGKAPDLDLYGYRSYKTIGGEIKHVPDFVIIKKGEPIYSDRAEWNQQINSYAQISKSNRKIKTISRRK